jgi:hypothetical protein
VAGCASACGCTDVHFERPARLVDGRPPTGFVVRISCATSSLQLARRRQRLTTSAHNVTHNADSHLSRNSLNSRAAHHCILSQAKCINTTSCSVRASRKATSFTSTRTSGGFLSSSAVHREASGPATACYPVGAHPTQPVYTPLGAASADRNPSSLEAGLRERKSCDVNSPESAMRPN